MTRLNINGIEQRWGEMQTATPPDDFVSNKQAAMYLCVNEKFLYTLRKQKNGPAYERRGRKILYTVKALADWRRRQMVPA